MRKHLTSRPPGEFLREGFRHFAHAAAAVVGSPWAFTLALAACIAWALTGPLFGFSDTWQLVINTSTTIVTFLMVFLIQNTQNRDAVALHLKLDELLRAISEARTGFVDVEVLSDEEIAALQREFKIERAHAGRILSAARRRRPVSRRRDRRRGGAGRSTRPRPREARSARRKTR